MSEENLEEQGPTMSNVCSMYRQKVKHLADGVKSMMNISSKGEDAGEQKANIMLAYRHLEDARMRLGKVIQAYEGGESIYDKK